jgi:predicted CopG family antitoxin
MVPPVSEVVRRLYSQKKGGMAGLARLHPWEESSWILGCNKSK